MIPISALHKYHLAELLEALHLQSLDTLQQTAAQEPKIAIIGRPNAGKSLLVNSLLGHSRCIVSPIAGTTRDSIDSSITFDGQLYTLIDTAGLRRTHKERAVVEKFATIRTREAIERADLCLLLVDTQYGISTEEKKIAKDIERAGKGCVVAFNKWDLIKNVRMEHAMRAAEEENPFLIHCPKIFISAKTGRNLTRLFSLFDTVLSSLHARISTPQLNKALAIWIQKYHPPMINMRRLRIYYMSQVATHPPHFVLFVNSSHLMDKSYQRYLTNRLRETFHFEGVPFIFTLRGKKSEKRSASKPTLDRDLSHIVEAYTESNPCNNSSNSDRESFFTI